MVDPGVLLDVLVENGVTFFAGVPDSLLKDFLLVVQSRIPASGHQVCANEGNAVALAAGHYLSTGEVPLVYMQNSGLGNAVNPLFSLCHQQVYGIPVLLLVGWRGEPGTSDEPQHWAMGAATEKLLQLLGIKSSIMDAAGDVEPASIERLLAEMKSTGSSHALLCRKGTFVRQAPLEARKRFELTRREAIEAVASRLKGGEALVCTTGQASRELHEIRAHSNSLGEGDFLNVGAMGHASQIALGLALGKPELTVICLDGDGSAIMHMGGFATIGASKASNFKHVLLNNGVHDSVGGQPSAGLLIDIPAIARSSGYQLAETCDKKAQLPEAIDRLLNCQGPALLEIAINPGSSEGLSRPPHDFRARTSEFMAFIASDRS